MAKFRCKNSECSKLDVEIDISEYNIFQRNGVIIFADKNKREVVCEECSQSLERIDSNEVFGFSVSIGSFNSKTPSQKKEMLKKRANEVYKSSKEMQEYKKHVDDTSNNII